MANLAITAANVLASANALKLEGVAAEAITAGQPVYKAATDGNRLNIADANTSAATSAVIGIALHGAAAGQPLTYVYEDSAFTPGGALPVGQTYCVSATAG